MIVYPNAKINLGLNVVAKRPDGYHDIETAFYPIPLQDALEVADAPTFRFRMAGTPLDCPAGDNLVIKVLQMVEQDFKLPELDIFLYKHIPSGAGLGGGSSDAAFMLMLLNERFGLGLTKEEMKARLATLGADCPFFVENRPVLATGIGDVMTPIDLSLAGWTLVLVKPDIAVSTAEAYAGVKPQKPATPIAEILKLPVEQWQGRLCNDFEESVFARHPEIAATRDLLLDLGATYAAMSGSGSAVFGLFKAPLEDIDKAFAGMFVRQRQLE
ncbi:MAG: 4-(cytidine 5'-diphospho)-2-C-methyl-D-erythritol kinase [Bacteroidaceae bacterium]|jgi:4-diphosphocytidyl-2-C-methyl-D-erythritol kinase|nr:4-(cytidine 5'-diphospho)-2-C-methyl-D-erythritol kinase [Bacteroidaceae bacterium]